MAALAAVSAAVLALLAPAYASSTSTALAQPGDASQVSTSGAEQGMVQITTTVDYQGVVGLGAGVITSPDGIVVTNNHVVAGADRITATSVGTGRKFSAQLLGYDRTNDIAVIQLVGAGGLPTAPLGDSNQVSVGEPVVGLGNAGGGNSVSREEGTVSTLNADIVAEDDLTGSSEKLSDLIGIAAPVRPGDSGGPLVNGAGQVIGMTVAASVKYRVGAPGGKGFAIPINRVLSIAGQIQSGARSDTVHIGSPALLGIGVRTGRQSGAGVEIRDILPGTPAEQAGLRRNDVIVAIGGVTLEDATALTSVLDRHYPGETVEVRWVDGSGQQRAANVTLAAGPHG
jgi:S1-C subfamily serine protease